MNEEQLKSFIENSVLLEEYVDSEEMEDSEYKLDIHKSWDAINYLLTQAAPTSPILTKAIFSGQILDEGQDMGYGPAQYLTTEQVKEISDALSNIPEVNLRRSYNASEMNAAGIYPQSWENNKEEIDWLVKDYRKLKKFYLLAAKQAQAIITYIE